MCCVLTVKRKLLPFWFGCKHMLCGASSIPCYGMGDSPLPSLFTYEDLQTVGGDRV